MASGLSPAVALVSRLNSLLDHIEARVRVADSLRESGDLVAALRIYGECNANMGLCESYARIAGLPLAVRSL